MMIQQATIEYSGNTKKKGQAQETDQHIGELIKEIRKRKSLTQEDVAEKLGVSFQQIQKYENGKNRISFSSVCELAKFMKVPLDSFQPASLGLSDGAQSSLQKPNNDTISQKETDELLKIYYSLEDPQLRKNLLKFIKTMAENLKE